MNLDELQSVRDRERQTDKLQQLRESFYADAGKFIQQLRTERDRAADRADNPFDAPEINRLTDEINTAEQTVEAIYEKRVGKVVKAASFAAADLPAEADGMTAEEQDLFDTLVEDIKSNRSYVLDVLAGDEDTASVGSGGAQASEQTPDPAGEQSHPPRDQASDDQQTADTAASPHRTTPTPPDEESPPPAEHPGSQPTDDGVSAADLMGGESGEVDSSDSAPPSDVPSDTTPAAQSRETPTESSAQVPQTGETSPGEEPGQSGTPAETGTADYPVREDGGTDTQPGIRRETVRITESVDTFVGSDERDYDLDRNDVVTLPSTNAQILVERDVAEQID